MAPTRNGDFPTAGSNRPGTADAADTVWESTRAQSAIATQVMPREGDGVASAGQDIGQPVGSDARELFVSCGPVEAMQQQFDVLRPEFVAIHDIGCAVSQRLLAGVAKASSRTLQKLTIRRQGYGTALATLEYIEWANRSGTPIRLYTTAIDADSAARHGLAHLLLAHSRLAVIIVGDLPSHALPAALAPLQQAIHQGPWPNRQMMLLPLSSASALAIQGTQLAGHSGIAVRTTPHVMRPAEAWGYISGAWNRLREQLGATGQALPVLAGVAPRRDPNAHVPAQPLAPPPVPVPQRAEAPPADFGAPTAPLPLRPMPDVPRKGSMPMRLEEMLADYVGRLLRLNGMLACCVFDTTTHAAVAQAGARFGAAQMVQQGQALLAASLHAAHALGATPGQPELALTLDAFHLLLRPLPRHPRLMLVAMLDKHNANLTLARLQVQRLDDEFEPAAAV